MAKITPLNDDEFKRMTTVLPSPEKLLLRELDSQGKRKTAENLLKPENKQTLEDAVAIRASLANRPGRPISGNYIPGQIPPAIKRNIMTTINKSISSIEDKLSPFYSEKDDPEDVKEYIKRLKSDVNKYGTGLYSQIPENIGKDLYDNLNNPAYNEIFNNYRGLREYIEGKEVRDCSGGKCVILRRGGRINRRIGM